MGLSASVQTFATQFRSTEAEYMSAHWAYLRHRPWRAFLHFRFPAVIVVVSAIVLLEYPHKWQQVGAIMLAGSGLLIFALLVYRRNWQRRFKKSAFGQDIVSARLNQQSVGFRLGGRELVKEWNEIEDTYESRLVFVFGWGRNGIVFLPKSGLNQSQIDEVRGLIRGIERPKRRNS